MKRKRRPKRMEERELTGDEIITIKDKIKAEYSSGPGLPDLREDDDEGESL